MKMQELFNVMFDGDATLLGDTEVRLMLDDPENGTLEVTSARKENGVLWLEVNWEAPPDEVEIHADPPRDEGNDK